MIFSDALAFLAEQGAPPVASSDLKLDLCHVTSAPPFSRRQKGQQPTVSETIEEHDQFIAAIVKQPSLKLVKSPRDFQEIGSDGITRVICGLQMPPSDLSYAALKTLKNAGIRIICIAYHGHNQFGAGFLNPYDPLTDKGTDFIQWCADTGMVLDLCQAGHQTAWDALDFIERAGISISVMASHTGVYGINGCWNPRNLPPEILLGIAELGGVVGIYALTFGLSDQDNSLRSFLLHLKRAIDVCGASHVCIGSDAVYQTRDFSEWQKRYHWLADNIDPQNRLRHRWPDQPLETNRPDFLNTICQLLLQSRISQKQAACIMGMSLLEFLREKI